MSNTLYINRDWESQADINDATNPFEDVASSVLKAGFGTIAFGSCSDAGSKLRSDTIVWFAACDSTSIYDDLSIAWGLSSVTISSAPYISYDTVYINSLNNNGILAVGPSSKFTFGSVTNGYQKSISISGSGTVFTVNGLFNNGGALSVMGGAMFAAGSFVTQGGGPSVTISGSDTVFTVNGLYDNGGPLSVTGGAKFTAGSFETQGGGPSVTISGSGTEFTVNGLYDNNGTLSVTDGAKFTADSFVTGGGMLSVTISGSDTVFTVNNDFENHGTLSVTGGAKFVSSGMVTIASSGNHISIKDSVFTADSICLEWNSSIDMNALSLIMAEDMSIDNPYSPSKVYVDVTGFRGSRKIIDVTGSGIDPSRISLTGDGAENVHIFVADGDINITTENNDILYVNSTWTGKTTGDIVNDHIYGYNAFDIVADAVDKAEAASDPTRIVVEGGTFDTTNTPKFNGINTTISDGTFNTSVCGGKVFESGPAEIAGTNNISLTINGGTFNKLVFTGDRVNGGGGQTRTGKLTTTITGGEFNSAVAGAMLVTASSAAAELNGDVELIIRGGSFGSWIYGGALASKKTYGGATTIHGNVTVTLDATANAIIFANLVVGSYGAGNIGTESDRKDTKLVLKGGNAITATGEIWGGSSCDIIMASKIAGKGNNREVNSTVTGSRILSFTGFSGTLSAETNRIRTFSDIELKDESAANLGGCVKLSDVENWSFEKGSSLTGDFINDFNGDTLDLQGFAGSSGTFTLLTDSDTSSNDIFKGFESLLDIRMNGVSKAKTYSSTDTTMTWAFDGGSVVVDKIAGTMSFIA